MKNEIVIYKNSDLEVSLEIKLENETLWLTQAQIVDLFAGSKANMSEHIKHIFESGELSEEATVRKFRIVRREGNRNVSRDVLHYSLDVIISVGYRVNSIRGTQFRIWANGILKDYLLRGYSLNNRMNRIEDNMHILSKHVNEIDLQINTHSLPRQGVFFEGQIFDAYIFVSDIIRSAKRSIVLIDNYIDDTVLKLFSKKNRDVSCFLYTQKISKQLILDVERFNKQYPSMTIKEFYKAHDRFMIIDKEQVYHIGASLKDLGKKWFAFSKLEIEPEIILNKIK
jgi:hypothetical protein